MPALTKALEGTPAERYTALAALERMWPNASTAAAPTLVRLLHTGGAAAEDDAQLVRAVGNAGPAAREAAPDLIAIAQSPKAKARREAIKALPQVGRDVPAAVPALAALVADAEVGSYAAAALAPFGPSARSAVPALVEAVRREQAKLAEDRAKNPTSGGGWTKFSTGDEAIRTLGFIGPDARSALPVLEPLFAQDLGPDLHRTLELAIESIKGAPAGAGERRSPGVPAPRPGTR